MAQFRFFLCALWFLNFQQPLTTKDTNLPRGMQGYSPQRSQRMKLSHN